MGIHIFFIISHDFFLVRLMMYDIPFRGNAYRPPPASNRVHATATPRPSFPATVSKPRLQPGFPLIDLPSRQYGNTNGKSVIHFTAVEYAAGAKLFQHSLIAKFTFGRPTIGEIRETFQAAWNVKGRATLADIWDSRHIMVILDSEDDLKSAVSPAQSARPSDTP
ncbi:hypothetical protein QQ045_002821 [Rhodiola kirilowii]